MAGGIATLLQWMKRFEESIDPLKAALTLCTGEVEGRPFHRGVVIALATAYYETKVDCEDIAFFLGSDCLMF